MTFSPPKYSLNAPPDYFLPCGKCPLCLAGKRQDWIRRITCETWLHPSNTFITLTYDDAHLPVASLVSKTDIQKFVKRLRHASRDYGVKPVEFKYYIASEYGSKFGRPHYHGVIFGIDMLVHEWLPKFIRLKSDGYPLWTSDVLSQIWQNGFVSVDKVTPRDLRYITKYITKDRDRNFSLYSRGLGKGVFFDADNRLTPFGDACYRNGFVAFQTAPNMFLKGALPKNIDRYLSIYEPSYYDVVKAIRREFAKAKTVSARVLSDALDSVKIKQRAENERRSYDSEH